jgi:hypothetical protein
MGGLPLEEVKLCWMGRAGSVGPFGLVVMGPLALHSGAAEVRARERVGGHNGVVDGRAGLMMRCRGYGSVSL